MFTIFRKRNKRILNDFSTIGVDIHSHLIPGIDDGTKDMESSLSLIQQMVDLGFNQLITSPHINNEYFPNTPEIIEKGLQKVRLALKEAGMHLDFGAAAEYYMDEYFEALLNKGDLLCLKKNYILVEMSFFGPPPLLEEYIFKLKLKGYQPILAHPERYVFYKGQLEPFIRLKELGCYLQVNILSLAGYYGKEIMEFGQKLIKNNMVELLGSDLHHQNHMDTIVAQMRNKNFAKYILDFEYKNKEFFS